MLDHLEPGRVEVVFVLVAADILHGHYSRLGYLLVRLGFVDVGRRRAGSIGGGEVVIERCMERRELGRGGGACGVLGDTGGVDGGR